jgi:hypothetical protein
MVFLFPEGPIVDPANRYPGLDGYWIPEMSFPHVLICDGQEIVRFYGNLDDQFSLTFQDLHHLSVLRKTLCRKVVFTMK